MPSCARAGRTTRTTDRASNTRVNRFIGILQPASVGWLAGGGLLLAVLDDDLAPGAEQLFRPDDGAPRRGRRAARVRGPAHTRLVCAGSVTSPLRRAPDRNTFGKNSMPAPARYTT